MNRIKRILFSFLSLMLVLHPKGPIKRARMFGKYHVFGSVGKGCLIQGWRVPLYSNLIFIHDNVQLASNVGFVTHDGIHRMLNRKYKTNEFIEKVGCIEIMDNVFVGSGTRILYNTRIGSNVIIGSDSFLNKDIPDNSVYASVPARYICSFDEYVEKARKYSEMVRENYGIDKMPCMNHILVSRMYENFVKARTK